jgi:hypothetical protein
MKNLFLLFFVFVAVQTNAQVKMPALSPMQTFSQDFGMGNIEIKYCRPSARGRKIFGDLLPYGEIWRTGANGATTIKFTDQVTINDKTIDTGTYAIYTIPGEKKWTFILNKGITNWGTNEYKESDDVLRFSTDNIKLKVPKETFTMQIANITTQSCELHIMWEKSSIVIPIKTDVKPKLKAQIEKALQSEKKPYYQAAQYYNDYEKDLSKALMYSQKAVEEKPEAYWIWLYQAKIQQKLGDKTGALESSKKSIEAAKKENADDYVRFNEEFQKTL